MYNPFALVSVPLLEAVIKSPKLFVRQIYGPDLPETQYTNTFSFLLTTYEKENHIERSRALFHMKQLELDKFAFLYDSENNEHRKKLFVAATQPVGYRIFINMLPAKWIPPLALRKKIHTYMLYNLPWWNYTKKNQLKIHMKDRYGELVLQLSWKSNKAEVLLDEIENYSKCATT